VRRQLRDSGPETIQARPSLQDAAKAMVENGLTNPAEYEGSSDMNLDEFAFFNQQLAGMLQSGSRWKRPSGDFCEWQRLSSR